MVRAIHGVEIEGYRSHPLHAHDRIWPETNCYVDVWIELLPALGFDPLAALSFTVAQDFEGDHFTFFKFPLEDLALLFGLTVQELAIYDSLESHVSTQVRRGYVPLVEVDGYFLPDTVGTSYRLSHSKTTVGINQIDPKNRTVEYFHGVGYHLAFGEDYDGLFRRFSDIAPDNDTLFPYVEFVKRDPSFQHGSVSATALVLLRRHLKRRPTTNPFQSFREALYAEADGLFAKPADYFHKYAFNTARQAGANFELLASHLSWLGRHDHSDFDACVELATELASTAKTFQFQMARAFARKRMTGLEPLLDRMASTHSALMGQLCARVF
jgi:Domain of unknown function (DUF1839)